MKSLETDILELNDNIDQSELSSQALNRYIEISTHYINMEKVEKARKILISIGFTKKSVEKYIIRATHDAEIHISEDFKLLMKGKVSKRYLNWWVKRMFSFIWQFLSGMILFVILVFGLLYLTKIFLGF